MSIVLEPPIIREGFTTVTPFIQARDAGFADFITKAFGAVEVSATPTPNHIHREMRLGNSMVMISERPSTEAPAPHGSFHLFVPDVDATFERAIAAGGSAIGHPENRPYGERSGFIQDPSGNYWFIATSLGPAPVPEGLRTLTPYLHPRSAPEYIDFLTRAFGAVEEFRAEHNGVVMHARVRIGDAAVEMGEAPARGEKPGFYLYVADVDALYERAVAAGAKSILAPANQEYGDRLAMVEDPLGVTWAIARPA